MVESLLRVLDLNPSVAIFPLRLAPGFTPQGVADSLFTQLEILVGRDPASGDLRKNLVEVQSIRPHEVGGWVYTGAVYRLDVAPSWLERTPAPNPVDRDDQDADEIGVVSDPKSGFR